MTFTRSIQAELLKLKYPPILWLVGFILIVTLAIIFSAYFLNIHNSVTLGRNPWSKLNSASQSIFAIFIGIPFIILFISAALHIEHQNHGFKQLYTFPENREILVLYKLVAFLFTILISIILLILGIVLVGYILNFIYPESEFTYYSIPIFGMIKGYSYILISFLGIIGFQFFLSLRFKNFLVPASVGILAYMIGLIVSSINSTISIYFPYSYPIIARERDVFNTSTLNIDQTVFLNRVEIYSISIFVFFLVLSLYTERKKNI